MGIFTAIGNIGYAKTLKKRYNELTESSYIPPSLNQAINNAGNQANATRYAGQDVDEQNIRNASNTAITNVQRGATSSANVLNAASQIQGNQNKAMAQVGGTLQRNKNQWFNNFNNLLLGRADRQQRNRDQYLAAKSALLGARDAAKMNVWKGVDDTVETAAKLALAPATAGMSMSDFYGGGK